MKKLLTSGIVLSMLIGVGNAFADPVAMPDPYPNAESLTTKKYVDDGLRAVYKKAKDAMDEITFTDTNTTYSAGDGISIDTENDENSINVNTGLGLTTDSENNVVIDGLSTTKQSGNTTKKYIYQNGALTELETVSDWNDEILNYTND